jgi:hypothetical protein
MRISIIILVVALLAACGSNGAPNSTRGLALGFEQPPAAAGEEVTLVLRNGSGSELGYNLCTSRLSHQRGGQWVPVGSRGNCPADQQRLQAGAEDTYGTQVPEDLGGGSYRYSLRVEVGGTRVEEIYSPTFQLPEVAPADTTEAAETPAA